MMKPRVLVTRKLLPEALVYLKKHAALEGGKARRGLSRAELKEKIRDKEGLLSFLVDQIDREVMEAAPRLRIIANCAVGFDNIDIGEARRLGILVTNTPGVLTEATADLTWALILATARKIPQADRFTRKKRLKGWELDLFLGQDLSGKRLGIIGMGRIGQAVARRAQAFRMDVVYNDPRRLTLGEEKASGAAFLPLDELLRTSDIVSVHASLNPSTFHLLSADKLSLMKKEAILVNAARGPIVDEEALAEALARRDIWGAGLDVYEKEPEVHPRLLKLDNVVLLPHIGSATYETRLRMAMTAARNLILGLRGERPENLVA
ncbi:MAG: D-glycerate dehydrogenase [Clostridiales bacterium]|nr:D-glycerate dehydrogenase [Clostridiales bacterium]